MLAMVYKWAYTKLGGRPWTHITREAARKRPLEWLLLFFLFGNLFGNLLPWRWELIVSVGLVAGVIVGHIFWGAPPSTWERRGRRGR
mgnify:CR=1 FL=1